MRNNKYGVQEGETTGAGGSTVSIHEPLTFKRPLGVMSFYGDGSKRAGGNNAPVLIIDELFMIDDPCLFVAHLEKKGVQFSTCPAAYT